MKRAAASDARRKVHLRNSKNCPIFKKLHIGGLNGFEDIRFEPNSGLFAVCGATGVGKSRLLELIEIALKPSKSGRKIFASKRLGYPRVELLITIDQNQYERVIDGSLIEQGSSAGYQPEYRLSTLAERTEDLQAIYEQFDIEIILEGSEGRALSDGDLQLLKTLLGKNLSEVICYEVEDPDYPDEIIPFFKVREGNFEYDIVDMGTGELSAIYILWMFNFVRPWSILLIEEPEAMLPPSCHLKIYDIVCRKAIEKQIGVVIATHSPDIVSAIPINHVLPITRHGGVSSYVSLENNKHSLLKSLGLKISKSGLIIVEDDMALRVSRELIARFNYDMFERIEIRSSKSGFGSIKSALEHLPSFNAVGIVGLLDGDMKEQSKNWPCADLCCFLPFNTSMEVEFLDTIRQDIPRFCARVERPPYQVRAGLASIEGMEAHDGLSDFFSQTGLIAEVAASQAFTHWLEVRQSHEVCLEVVESIAIALRIR